MPEKKENKFMPWLRLLRLPNLFTAPGDSLAGYFRATTFRSDASICVWRIVLLAAISVFTYAFGIVMNDIMDYQEDCRNRPERPLPSGKISSDRATIFCAQLWVGLWRPERVTFENERLIPKNGRMRRVRIANITLKKDGTWEFEIL